MSNEVMIRARVYLPKETLRQIDERRGRYYSRNKYLLKVLEEHWNEEDNESKDNVQGPKGTAPTAQAPPRIPTTTTPISQQPDAEDPTNTQADLMSTTSGSSRVQLGGSGDDAVV